MPPRCLAYSTIALSIEKRRVKINGKFKWKAPNYVEIHRHQIPHTKRTLRAKSGTQIVERCWRYLKDRLSINQHSKVGSRLLRIQLCSAQYEYWLRGQDLWTATSSLVQWFMAKSYRGLDLDLSNKRPGAKCACMSAATIRDGSLRKKQPSFIFFLYLELIHRHLLTAYLVELCSDFDHACL